MLTLVGREMAELPAPTTRHEPVVLGRESHTFLAHPGGEARLCADNPGYHRHEGRLVFGDGEPTLPSRPCLGGLRCPGFRSEGVQRVFARRCWGFRGGTDGGRYELGLSSRKCPMAPSHSMASTGVASRLDRTFASIPGCAADGLVIRSEMQAGPHEFHRMCLRDHMLVQLSIQLRACSQWRAPSYARSPVIRGSRRSCGAWGFASWSVEDRVTPYPERRAALHGLCASGINGEGAFRVV